VLELLGDVRWHGSTVAGDRPRALLATLAGSQGRPVRTEVLIEHIWGDETPANATKSLQVLVSRTRSVCGEQAIVHVPIGYRLGLKPAEVDSVRLGELVREARAAIDLDAVAAADLAREAIALAAGLPGAAPQAQDSAAQRAGTAQREDPAQRDPRPLSELRDAARADAAEAAVILARALSRTGKHAEALPLLIDAFGQQPADDALLADLLRSEAAVHGPATALERYERYRRELRERLGTNPGDGLQRVQRELLALDQPVRGGLRYDATTLFGRDGDLEALRGLLVSARVVSIVGPGGLGKTRLANVLARDTTLPVVHVVELAGVSAAEDLVGEVGSALGVRDSVNVRRALTPAQRADVRARIAQQLGQAPSLLVLDNCEHLIEAVAGLVAFLVASVPDLRVLTTSRAPLAIAAEHVYLLGQLQSTDAVALFRERAVAARPDVQLEDKAVTSIVARLDGLPLAIELAAAKVRVMSVSEIDRRLENRFALLRGGDRSAPDRHQTLLAVIDWSWNLLDPEARRALRRLSPFNDGFTLQAADAALGDGALAAVQALVNQSLLSVVERPSGLRYRMLETVREFGRMQLIDAGEDVEALAARRAWATGYASGQFGRLAGPDQLAAIDALVAEEVNLADELRATIADGDVGNAVALLAPLGSFWSIRGEHVRLATLAGALAQAVGDWTPPPELENTTRAALAVVVANGMIVSDRQTLLLRELLARLGPGSGDDARLAGMVRVALAVDGAEPEASHRVLATLARDSDRFTAVAANQWLSHFLENGGDPHGAIAAIRRALQLVDDGDGPWQEAALRGELAQLLVQIGDRQLASEQARAALPVMQRIGAVDDAIQLHTVLAACAFADGRLEVAEAEFTEIDRLAATGTGLLGMLQQQIGRAELLLARGEHEAGLALYRQSVQTAQDVEFPGFPRTRLEPWVVVAEATALAAHAKHASDIAELAEGRALFTATREHTLAMLGGEGVRRDYPVAGLFLFALGAWAQRHEAVPVELAARLLVLADRFAYNRAIPSLSWEWIAPLVEADAPGLLEGLRESYGDRPPRELLGEVRRVVEQLPHEGLSPPR